MLRPLAPVALALVLLLSGCGQLPSSPEPHRTHGKTPSPVGVEAPALDGSFQPAAT